MQPHRPAPPKPHKPSEAATPAETVKTEPAHSTSDIKKSDLAAALKEADARLAEAEKRIRPPIKPYTDPAAWSIETQPAKVETQTKPELPVEEPRTTDVDVDAKSMEAPAKAETQTEPPTAEPPAAELPAAEPLTDAPATKDTETSPDKTETQTELPAEPSADLIAMLKETEARLLEAEKNAAEQHDACLRARAEAENIRRRAQEDIAKASKFAAEKFAGTMLPVKDSLEAALATESQTPEKLREGVELTLKQLAAAFEGANLIEENPLGQKFDPNKHQAIGTLESEAEPNTVINVLQKGYLLHGRIIRPAMVMVSKAKG